MGAARGPILAFATVTLAVSIAGAFAIATERSTNELPEFFVWSLPLGIAVWVFAQRPRFLRLPRFARAVTAAALGLITGVGFTLVSWLFVGAWMLAWNFPVPYCWSLAGMAGMLAAMLSTHAARGVDAVGAGALTLLPLAASTYFARGLPRGVSQT